MKKHLVTILLLLLTTCVYAQGVGIGTVPNPSAMLDVSSTSRGLLAPRVALTGTTDATTITNGNVVSLLVYNTATVSDVTPGYYYWDGSIWRSIDNTDHDWYEVGTTAPPNNINDNMYTEGRVGIASTAPLTSLQIGNSPAGTYRAWMEYGVIIGEDTDGIFVGVKDEGPDQDDAIIAWGDNPQDDLRFLYNQSGLTTSQEVMILQPNGNIGIGESNPTNRVTVGANLGTGYGISLNPGTPYGQLIETTEATASNNPAFWVRTNNGTTTDQLFRVQNDGNVGIRTANPLGALHVYNPTPYTGNDNDNASNSIVLHGAVSNAIGNHYGGITWANGTRKRAGISSVMENADADYLGLAFWTQGTDGPGPMFESMRINHNGNVGIGTTNATSKLTVNGVLEINKVADVSTIFFTTSATEPGYIRHRGNANAAEMRFVASDDFDVGSAQDKFTFGGETGGVFTEVMRIQGDGSVGIGTTAPAQRLHVIGNILASGTITSSDERYKEDIQELENSSKLLASIRPVAYNFRTETFKEGQFDDKLHYGIIAQELENVLPNLVYTDLEGYKGINYTELIPLLIKSNQEQQAQIKQQQEQINQLINAVEALKK